MPSQTALRQQLAALLPPPRTGTGAVPTGLAALDLALSDGGLPAGRLTGITGRRGSGRTTLVRQLVTAAVAARRWVAVVDGSRTLVPRDWAAAGGSGRLWVIRPPQADRSAWCADILLRSGAFSLVVLDGAPAFSRQVAVRLTRLAREHDVALVVTGDEDSTIVGSAVRLRVRRGRREWGAGSPRRARNHDPSVSPLPIPISVLIDKGGTHHSVEVSCAIDLAHRLCAHPEVPDRRGVATRNRRGERVESTHRRERGDAGRHRESERRPTADPGAGHHDAGQCPPAAGSVLPRKRRCAEPLVRRDEFLLART